MVRGLKNLSYENRLKSLNMCSLKHRRLRGDMIELFKILKGTDELGFKNMFKMSQNRTRGHRFKLQKQHVKSRQRQNFFSQRVINAWNKLPADVVESPTIGTFKNRFDSFYKERY